METLRAPLIAEMMKSEFCHPTAFDPRSGIRFEPVIC